MQRLLREIEIPEKAHERREHAARFGAINGIDRFTRASGGLTTTFTVGDQDIFLRENIQPQHIWLASLDSAGTTASAPAACAT